MVVTGEAAIEIKDLRVDYGDNLAVDGLSVSVPRGEIFGLLGPNGAGKTSTFRVVATLLEPTYGQVELCGIDIAEGPEAVRHLLGYMPDLAPVPSDLKVWEFLDLFAAAHGLVGARRKERVEECLRAVRLLEKRDALCNTLSRGMKQRLVLARNLLHHPRVMVLDEPASGMDPVSRAALRETLRGLAAEGVTVMISSHILNELQNLCTSVGILCNGRLLDSGSIDDVVRRSGLVAKRIRIVFLEGVEVAGGLLAAQDAVFELEVRPGAGTAAFRFSGGDDAQAELLEDLLRQGCRVRSFEEQTASIEDIILSLEGGGGN